jgi:hypothetical protein
MADGRLSAPSTPTGVFPCPRSLSHRPGLTVPPARFAWRSRRAERSGVHGDGVYGPIAPTMSRLALCPAAERDRSAGRLETDG